MTSGQLAIQVTPSAGQPLELRPYQLEAVQAVLAARDRGIQRPLVVAATGLGKTVIATGLAAQLGVRTLWLAHRDELIGQAVEKFRQAWPAASLGVVKAGRDESGGDIVVASVQTLARQQRLDRLARDFGLIVTDEAHHYASDQWYKVLARLGCFHPEGPLLVGLTATPDRGDGRGLDRVFQEIVCHYDILWGIRHSYLSDLRAKQVLLDLNLEDVKVTRGDYDEGQLGRAMTAVGAPAHIAEAWQQHGEGRKTVVFMPTVQLARDTALAFEPLGVPVGFIHGKTPLEERRQVLADFRHGHIQVLVNCAVLTEGWDEPSVECIVIGRPTKSRLLYCQMAGRGVRKFPGKTDCLVIDVVGATDDHSLVTIPSLFGLLRRTLQRLTVAEAAALKELGQLDGEPERSGPGLNEDPKGTLVARDIDLFPTRLSWVPASAGRFVMAVKDGGLCLTPANYLDGTWTVVEVLHGQARTLREGVTLEMAQGIGEDRVRELGAGLAHKRASWRTRPASANQLRWLRGLGVSAVDGITAGEASDKITAANIVKALT